MPLKHKRIWSCGKPGPAEVKCLYGLPSETLSRGLLREYLCRCCEDLITIPAGSNPTNRGSHSLYLVCPTRLATREACRCNNHHFSVADVHRDDLLRRLADSFHGAKPRVMKCLRKLRIRARNVRHPSLVVNEEAWSLRVEHVQ